VRANSEKMPSRSCVSAGFVTAERMVRKGRGKRMVHFIFGFDTPQLAAETRPKVKDRNCRSPREKIGEYPAACCEVSEANGG